MCIYIEGLSKTKEKKLYWKVAQRIVLENCPTVRVGGCPKNSFGELSNNSPWRIVVRRVVQ